MKHPTILILLMSFVKISFSQEIDPNTKEIVDNKYYPENKVIRKNRIKHIIDSNEYILPNKIDINIYDSLGRNINRFYNRSIDSTTPPFIYKKTGDTLVLLKFYEGQSEPFSFERFIYNKRGQIVSYLECRNYHFKEDSYVVTYDEFFYDENGAIKTKLHFVENEYPGKVSEENIIDIKKLDLYDVINYSFKTLKTGNRLIIGQHAIGKPEWRATDSTIFDKQNRIIRFNSFAKMGFEGEMAHEKLNRITEYNYTDSSVTIIEYSSHCLASISDKECLLYSEPYKSKTLIVYNSNKTKKAVYTFYADGEKRLKSKYQYFYY